MLSLSFITTANALTINIDTTSVNACKDYFTSQWGERIDMVNDGPYNSDILRNLLLHGSEYTELSTPNCSGGLCSMTTTGVNGFFRVLTPSSSVEQISHEVTRYGAERPISSSEYSVLTFRMNATSTSQYVVRWDSGTSAGYTEPKTVYPGWNTYQVDLNSSPAQSGSKAWNNGNNIGLGIYPALQTNGNALQVDWLQLTGATATCDNATFTSTATAGKVVSLFVDDNNDPSDGFLDRKNPTVSTGAATAVNFNASKFYPGTYKAIGVESDDFASHGLNPWDMASSADIVAGSESGISNISYSGGQFCGTITNGDPSFKVTFPKGLTLDSSIFKYITIKQTGLGVGNRIEVRAIDSNGDFASVFRNLNVTGDGVLTADLQAGAHPFDSGSWTGSYYGIRIDPSNGNSYIGNNFCIDFVSIAKNALVTEAAFTSTPVVAGSQVIIGNAGIAPFTIPDGRGGLDYFASVKSNPINFDSTNDIADTYNVQNVVLYPGKAYTDVSGAAYVDDFMEFYNLQTKTLVDGDPAITFLKRETSVPIDAARFRYACVKYDLPDVAAGSGHSVGRWGWELPNFSGYTSDDIIPRGTTDGEYCVDLKTAQIEDGTGSHTGNYWADPGQSNQVISFRFDPHEEESLVKTRLNEIRLATRHEANNKFTVVLGGDRNLAVSVYKNTTQSTTGGTLIGTLPANRTTDYLIWDTSGETNGTEYYLYSQIGTTKHLSFFPVVINKSFSDTSSPILELDAPASNGSGRYQTLDLAGFAVDNVRLANIRALVDGVLVASFVPSDLRIDKRNNYSSYPDASRGGFQKSIDLSAFADGARVLNIEAVDTAGNITTITRNFTKTSVTTTSPVSYPVPNENSISIASSTPVPTAIPTSVPRSSGSISFSGKADVKKLTYALTFNQSNCSTISIVGNIDKNKLSAGKGNIQLFSFTPSSGSPKYQVTKLNKVKTGSVFLRATCSYSGGSTNSSVLTVAASKFKAKKTVSLASFLSSLKKSRQQLQN